MDANLPVPVRVIDDDDAAARADRLVDLYMNTVSNANTKAGYRRDLGYWLEWCAAQYADPLTAPTTLVLLWLANLTDCGYSAATRARALSSVVNWYEWMIGEGRIDRNPAKIPKTRRPKVDKSHSDTIGLSPAQARALQVQADADGTSSSAAVAMLLNCALRISELADATTADLAMDRGHRVLRVEGKGGRIAWVPVPPAAYARLERHLTTRAAHVERLPALAGQPGVAQRLVLNRHGRPLNESYVRRLLKGLAAAAGGDLAELVDRIHPHVTRHTAITAALDANMPLRDVQDWARHRDPNTTRRYDRSRNNPDRSPGYRVAALLAPDLEGR